MSPIPSFFRRLLLPLALACVLPLGAAEGQSASASGTPALSAIRVQAEGHYLETADGRPFFWLGDTAWNLIHATTREEASYYLRTRARQGYNVIQTVALSEHDGILTDSSLGLRPFIENNLLRPNEAYFDRIVELVDEAAKRGLYICLLPTWGDKITAPWGAGPRLFSLDKLGEARGYARYLGGKLKGRTNIVWMLGGDRPPKLDPSKPAPEGFSPGTDWRPIWREMAAGLAEGLGAEPVCLYHPAGYACTSDDLHNEGWLDINGMQSGHGSGHDVPVWDWVTRDFGLTPTKPTLDLEPNYEDHPVNPWPRWDPSLGYFRDHDVRKQCYRSVLAGACGVTYGHHAIWGFAGKRNEARNFADRDWVDAMYRPGGRQMVFLRQLIESRPFFTRIPDQSLIANPSPAPAMHITACRDRDGTYAFAYFPTSDQTAAIDLAKLRPGKIRAWWYDPRTGFPHPLGLIEGGVVREFQSPAYGPDWVLVLDSEDAGYGPPGGLSRSAALW